MKRILWLAGFAYVSFLTQTMSANVVGTLDVANCNGGGVLVTSTTITWLPAASTQPVLLAGAPANTGCISAGIGTGLTWSGGGSMTSGLGWIQDEPGAPPAAFMVFPPSGGNTTQQLNFFLTNGFGFTPPAGYQGSGQTACSNAAATPGDSCTLFAGSPFLLTGNANGTTDVKLFAAGTVADPNNGTGSTWSGTFETNLGGSPTSVYNQICGASNAAPTAANCTGSGQSTFANIITVVGPEPGTTAMILLGGILMVASSYRKRRARA
jgi:hypothetical protein